MDATQDRTLCRFSYNISTIFENFRRQELFVSQDGQSKVIHLKSKIAELNLNCMQIFVSDLLNLDTLTRRNGNKHLSSSCHSAKCKNNSVSTTEFLNNSPTFSKSLCVQTCSDMNRHVQTLQLVSGTQASVEQYAVIWVNGDKAKSCSASSVETFW